MRDDTHIWQEQQGKAAFRVQTVNMDVHLYLLKRQEFKLVGEGVNTELWIHRAEFSSVKRGRQVLEQLAEENRGLGPAVRNALCHAKMGL